MKKVILLNIILWLVLNLNIQAQWSSDPNINNPICTFTGNQQHPNIISDGNGGAIITWELITNNGSQLDIYAQKIGSDGAIKWSKNGIVLCTNIVLGPIYPFIISDGSGGAIFTWVDYRNGYSNSDIYAQRIDSNGVEIWATGGLVICGASSNQTEATIVDDKNGGAIIAWRDERFSIYGNIYAQRIDSNGVIQWIPDGQPICSVRDGQSYPMLVNGREGGAIITWQDFRSRSIIDIYSQKIDSSGNIRWVNDGINVSNATYAQYDLLTSTADDNGGVIVTWQDNRNGNKDIYSQRINYAGDIQWTATGIAICTASGEQSQITQTKNDNGGAVISWTDYRSGPQNSDIYAQGIDSNGVTQWTSNGRSICIANGEQHTPRIISDGQGGAIICWTDFRSGGINSNIYAQKIDTNGTNQWPLNGVAICTGASLQNTPTLTGDGAAGAIIVWQDIRNTNDYDIYASLVNPNGSLGTTTGIVEDQKTISNFELSQNYPNPFNPITSIQYAIASRQFVNLKVYDVLGTEITTLVNEEKPDGTYEVTWGAASLTSGVYFYRLQAGDFVQTRKMILLK